MTGQADEGLALLDESMAAVSAGELTETATVDRLYCRLFWACELVNDVPRADQWIRAASESWPAGSGRCILPRTLWRHTYRGRTVAGGRGAAHRCRSPL